MCSTERKTLLYSKNISMPFWNSTSFAKLLHFKCIYFSNIYTFLKTTILLKSYYFFCTIKFFVKCSCNIYFTSYKNKIFLKNKICFKYVGTNTVFLKNTTFLNLNFFFNFSQKLYFFQYYFKKYYFYKNLIFSNIMQKYYVSHNYYLFKFVPKIIFSCIKY